MLRLAVDEDFDQRIVLGLKRLRPDAVSQSLPTGKAVEDLLLLAECTREGEIEGQVLHLPLR